MSTLHERLDAARGIDTPPTEPASFDAWTDTQRCAEYGQHFANTRHPLAECPTYGTERIPGLGAAPEPLTTDAGVVVCPNWPDGGYHDVELAEYVERTWRAPVKVIDGGLVVAGDTDEIKWESTHPDGMTLVCRGCLWERTVTEEVDYL